MQNPLFPIDPSDPSSPAGPTGPQGLPDYLQTGRSATPAPSQPQPASTFDTPYIAPQTPAIPATSVAPQAITAQATDSEAAVNLIRQKLAAIYADEPVAEQELAQASTIQTLHHPVSKHQQYLLQLNNSGRGPIDIQTAWHEYYANLPDTEKHEVWQEFYANSQATTAQTTPQYQPAVSVPATPEPATYQPVQPTSPYNLAPVATNPISPAALKHKTERFKDSARQTIAKHADKAPSIRDIKQKVRDTVSAQGSLQKKHHLQSLFFGLATGAVVVFVVMFSFFNEIFLSPFIQPSRTATETPVIVDPASAVVGNTPKVVIPKINVEIPVDYSVTTASNSAVEAALDNGIVHYPTTVRPGTAGNAAFFGHSSNNIFNPGKYKFAFVLLHKLVEGDTFYLTNEGKTYAYQVISRRVVDPSEVGVLGPVPDQVATATLITCDPPGTSLKRLVVVGKQISPDPAGNPAPGTPTPLVASAEPAVELAGNGPTLWGRIWGAVF